MSIPTPPEPEDPNIDAPPLPPPEPERDPEQEPP